MLVNISRQYRDRYESETGEYYDEWTKDTTFMKVPTWDYVVWLEEIIRKKQENNGKE
jgi:hypothetical protein